MEKAIEVLLTARPLDIMLSEIGLKTKEFQKRELWRPYEELLDEENEKDRTHAQKV